MREPEKSEIEECIAKFGKDLYSFCYSLTMNKTEADDLYQDTFLKAMEIGIKLSENPKSFLLSVAVRLWKNRKRKLMKRSRLVCAEDITELYEEKFATVHSDTPEEAAMKREEIRLIRSAVEHLPDRYKVVALLFYMEDKEVKEISEIIRIPQGTVKSRLFKARELLYQTLTEAGV